LVAWQNRIVGQGVKRADQFEANPNNWRTHSQSQRDALLGQLSLDEIRFLIARSETTTDKEAATAIGYSPRTIIGWPAERKELIRQALRLESNVDIDLDGLTSGQLEALAELARKAEGDHPGG
jgi:hypothetical protein